MRTIILFFVCCIPCFAEVENFGNFIVKRVIDGDTIVVKENKLNDAKEFTVRFLLVDCPETRSVIKQGRRVNPEEFGQEAKAFTEKQLASVDNKVHLKTDGVIRERSRFGSQGRYLALVYLASPNGKCLNELLVKEGFARVRAEFAYKTENSGKNKASYKTLKYLQEAENFAKERRNGIWK